MMGEGTFLACLLLRSAKDFMTGFCLFSLAKRVCFSRSGADAEGRAAFCIFGTGKRSKSFAMSPEDTVLRRRALLPIPLIPAEMLDFRCGGELALGRGDSSESD